MQVLSLSFIRQLFGKGAFGSSAAQMQKCLVLKIVWSAVWARSEPMFRHHVACAGFVFTVFRAAPWQCACTSDEGAARLCREAQQRYNRIIEPCLSTTLPCSTFPSIPRSLGVRTSTCDQGRSQPQLPTWSHACSLPARHASDP